MLEQLKAAIAQNKEINDSLQGCSDELLSKNAALIYKALSGAEVFKGYKLDLWYEDGEIMWDYIPSSPETKKTDRIKQISSKYTFKLAQGQENSYLTDLNQVTWTEDRAPFSVTIKKLFASLDANEKPKGFWLQGPNNSGKSFIMIAMLNMLADKGYKVAYVPVNELVNKTQSAMKGWDNSYVDYLEDINRAQVVVIDDLGVERSTPWFKENILLPIIDYRSMAEKTTIFCSNVDIESYGSRLKYRSQSPETEEVTNEKIVARIRHLIDKEIQIG